MCIRDSVWIDDMFMITTIQSQAYLATGDRKYIDRAAAEMAMYLEKIQRPNGLFYHAPTAPARSIYFRSPVAR